MTYQCKKCRHLEREWFPRCPLCGTWLAMGQAQGIAGFAVSADQPVGASPLALAKYERAEAPSMMPEMPATAAQPILVSEIPDDNWERIPTGIAPLDAVLGGGIVPGGIWVISALPGAGKSSCTLQMLAGIGLPCLYATGEQPLEHVKAIAIRCNAIGPALFMVHEANVETIMGQAFRTGARVLAVDSIQKLWSPTVDSRPGLQLQVKVCTQLLCEFARSHHIAVWIISQVNKDGGIAASKAVEHDVDVTLELEEEADGGLVLSSSKNRFAATDVVGRFVMTDKGLVPRRGS